MHFEECDIEGIDAVSAAPFERQGRFFIFAEPSQLPTLARLVNFE